MIKEITPKAILREISISVIVECPHCGKELKISPFTLKSIKVYQCSCGGNFRVRVSFFNIGYS